MFQEFKGGHNVKAVFTKDPNKILGIAQPINARSLHDINPEIGCGGVTLEDAAHREVYCPSADFNNRFVFYLIGDNVFGNKILARLITHS